MPNRSIPSLLLTAAALLVAPAMGAEDHAHHHAGHAAPGAAMPDGREPVKFPPDLAAHTRANMRDHLLAIQEMTAYLSEGKYDLAAHTAEQRLGMSSLPSHGAHEVAKYMPAGMKAIGSGMHRAASEFSLAAQNVNVTGDLKPALAALARLQGGCVACHAGFRLE